MSNAPATMNQVVDIRCSGMRWTCGLTHNAADHFAPSTRQMRPPVIDRYQSTRKTNAAIGVGTSAPANNPSGAMAPSKKRPTSACPAGLAFAMTVTRRRRQLPNPPRALARHRDSERASLDTISALSLTAVNAVGPRNSKSSANSLSTCAKGLGIWASWARVCQALSRSRSSLPAVGCAGIGR